jgi:glycosyltransferase involved in cell wall biosynthesis
MRICLITREYPPETGWGGIATFSYHLAHGLKELGNEVVVVSLAQSEARVQNDEGILVHRLAGYKVPGEFGAISSSMPYSRTVLEACTSLWQKFLDLHEQKPFDVVDTPELLADGLYPAVTSVAPLVVRLYTPHFKFVAEQLHGTSNNFDHQFVAMLERLALLQADAITSPSDDLAGFVCRDLNYPLGRVTIVRNPIDPEAFSCDGPTALPATTKKRVIFVGRLEERKGVKYLVEAIPGIFNECPDTEFVIIGDDTINAAGGKQSTMAELQAFLRKEKALAGVKFIARVPLADLPAYYRSCDICVVPSLYDNSPYTCLEAMACGRPVVGTSGGGTKEYVTHGESGLIVAPQDAGALQSAIVTLLRNDELRLRMARQARQDVLDKFQRREIARQTLDLYQLASQRFATRTSRLYQKAIDHALPDAAVFLYSFDKMVYDMLYQHSWRFRIGHWLRKSKARPRLFAARVVLRLAKAGTALVTRNRVSQPAFVRWLEQQIEERETAVR